MLTTFAFAMLLAADNCSLGAEAVQRRDLSAAEALLKSCDQLQGYLLLAGIYQSRQDAAALYRTATEGMKRFPSEKRFYLVAATHDAREKRYESAINLLEQGIRRWPDDPKLRSLLASAHFALGTEMLDAHKDEGAIQHLSKATELAPDDLEAQMNLGRALHNSLRHEEARKIFDQVIQQNSSFPLVYFHRGLALYALGDFANAIADLNKEIATGSDYPPARLIRGLALIATAEWDAAWKDLEIASARMPANAAAHYGLGRALVRLGRLDAAEGALTKAIELDPSDPAPVNTLVSVLLRLERREEARKLAAKAAELARGRRTAGANEIRFEKKDRP